jgi:hypothetical protein
MQEFFTHAAVALELASFSYITGSFAIYAHRRIHQSAQWVPQEFRERVSNKAIASSYIRAENLDQVLSSAQVKRQLSPVEQLRQQCQQAGIKWRDAHGKNKHLKKVELIAALQQLELERLELERSKHVAVPQPKPNGQQAA